VFFELENSPLNLKRIRFVVDTGSLLSSSWKVFSPDSRDTPNCIMGAITLAEPPLKYRERKKIIVEVLGIISYPVKYIPPKDFT
jgi:hypothetical protein